MASIPVHPPGTGHDDTTRATIVVIDPRTLLRGCLVRTLMTEFPDLDIAEVISPQRCACLGLVAPRLIILGFTAEALCETQMSQDIDILRGAFPETPIALICDDDERSLQYAIRFGCNGYVPTSLPLEIAVAALRLVLVGGLYFPQAGAHAPDHGTTGYGSNGYGTAGHGLPLRDGPGSITVAALPPGQASAPARAGDAARLVAASAAPPAGLPGFTPREAQVIEALQLGRSNKVIAGDLNLSENTVKVHVRHIMRKLKATNRTQAALRSQVLRSPVLSAI